VNVDGFSKSEKIALEMFRSRVNGTLPQEFMKTNAFLIRWLRLNNLNVGEAEAELKTYLEAREREGVDNITPEDVRGMAKIMPFRLEGVDKHGRPILEYLYGKSEFRRLALAGKSELAPKYLLFYCEKALRKAIDIAERTGKDVDSFYFIPDVDGFNSRNHLCVSCFPITLRFIHVYNSILGPFIKHNRVINAPRIFAPVTAAVKQILKAKILEPLVVYDANKENWKKVLAEDIDLDQLPPRLGGTNTQFGFKGEVQKTN